MGWHLNHSRAALASTLAVSAALVAIPSPPAHAAPTTGVPGAKKARPLSSLPATQRRQLRKLITKRRAQRGSVRARVAYTQRVWYDNYRFATSASAQSLQGYTYISVWNPIVRTINGLSSQRVAFRALIYNPNTGEAAVSTGGPEPRWTGAATPEPAPAAPFTTLARARGTTATVPSLSGRSAATGGPTCSSSGTRPTATSNARSAPGSHKQHERRGGRAAASPRQ